MNKRSKTILSIIIILFFAIFIYKWIDQLRLKQKIAKSINAPVSVSAIRVKPMAWQQQYIASANIVAVKGVNVTTQIQGQVQAIYFRPGDFVEENSVLVQLNADPDNALLHSLEAAADLAKINYERDKKQYETVHAVSKSVVDTDFENLKSAIAQVAQQKAIVKQKTIRAPFSGFLGIRLVNIGQFLNPGDAIVTIQTFNPIFADFYLPQQALSNLHLGDEVIITNDTYPNKKFIGKITTINPLVDVSTRNVLVEATVDNPEKLLYPGMYASSEVHFGKPTNYITLPLAAVSFKPYGQIVYIVKEKEKKGKTSLIVKECFVTTGETRGDLIAILKGLNENDMVVTAGQLKLRNNASVVIDNTHVPPAELNPYVMNDIL